MSYERLVRHFSTVEDLPIAVDAVLDWITTHTDHKDLRLHPVKRGHKAFRGAFRRIGVPIGKAYSHDFEIITQILFGEDLPEDWKRLVIVKEALHVFDPDNHRVDTPEAVRKLIPAVITPELLSSTAFAPAVDDYLGAYKAMAVLLPKNARRKLRAAAEEDKRTSGEIANFAKLPAHYVDIWLNVADEVENSLCGYIS
jgi:hypothetical protein